MRVYWTEACQALPIAVVISACECFFPRTAVARSSLAKTLRTWDGMVRDQCGPRSPDARACQWLPAS